MTAVNFERKCKHCPAKIVWLKKADKNIAVNVESLSYEDRRSLAMGLTVPFSPLEHRKHIETCPYYRNKSNYRVAMPWRR